MTSGRQPGDAARSDAEGSSAASSAAESYGIALQEAVDALPGGRAAVVDAVMGRLAVPGSVIAVWDFDSAAGELICARSNLRQLIDRRVPLGVGVAGWVASMRAPVGVEDRRTDRRGDHFSGDQQIPVAGAAVPIPGGQHYTGGVLEVYGPNGRFGADADLVALARLAAVIAVDTHDVVSEPNHAVASSESVTEVERLNRRMAAELHDGVSQRLASLSFHLAAANSALAELSPEVRAESDAQSDPVHFAMRQLIVAGELSQLAADDVRAAISGLQPPVLDDLGLANGLVGLCGALGAGTLAVEIDVEDVEPPFISSAVSLALYRVAQEALRNAVKHAGVASVRVRLQRRGGNVVLDVRDDGVGYAPVPDGTPPARTNGPEGGFGLRSMAERMVAIGGRIELWSAPGRGTHVRAIVPDEPRKSR